MEDESFSIEVLIFMTILAVYVLASYYIQKLQLTFLHESTIAIFLGFLTALFLRLIMDKEISFSNDLFFALLLPPIVFSQGYSIQKTQFFQHFLTILFFGIVSTLLAIFLQTAILTYISSIFSLNLSTKDVLLISIVSASSDPITALPLLKSHTQKLNAIVSGQSVLNSAVVIILFSTVAKIGTDVDLQTSIVHTLLPDFAYVFLCSLLLGIFSGLGLSYLFKKVESFNQHHIKQTSLILLTGYAVYLFGQFLGLSGIIALFTTAIVFSQYGFNNLSLESRHGTALAFESIRYIFQAFIFAYLGASLLTIQGKWNALGISLLILCLIPLLRLLIVVFVPLLYRIFRRPFPLATKQQKLLWYTGLSRGVIAFALSLTIDTQNRQYLRTVALIVVVFTTVVGSTLLNRFCQFIGLGNIGVIRTGSGKEEDRDIEMKPSTKYGVIGAHEEIKEVPKKEALERFEQQYIRPIFIRQNSDNEKQAESEMRKVSIDV